MFIDRAEIFVRGGRGGDGCVSFRREKFIARGGPDGGDGGRGGDVILVADPGVNTLIDLTGRHHWIARDGEAGRGKNQTGRAGDDCLIPVPPGTLVYDRDEGRLLKDLNEPHVTVCIARGGRGGKGNHHFASSRRQAPRFAQPGEQPEERWLRLDLKLIADVGLVGLPNAGKSTLLSRVTRARPRIADYPFTTLEPQLGIVEMPGFHRFVMADLPGLIEGAHEGVGLGDDFLRHIERTRVIVHLIDVHPIVASPSPAQAYRIIRGELEKYSRALADKPELVVANKIDLADSLHAVDDLSRTLQRDVLPISAVTGAGLESLSQRLWRMIQDARRADEQQRLRTPGTTVYTGAADDPFAAPAGEPAPRPNDPTSPSATGSL